MSSDPSGVTVGRDERSLGELFGELTSELGLLLRQELDLAKTEAREEARRAGMAAAWFAGTAIAGLLALGMLSLAIAWLLDDAMPRPLAFVIVGVLWLADAALMLAAARKRAKDIAPLPTTAQTLKEDAQWLKTPTS